MARSTGTEDDSESTGPNYVEPQAADALEQAWLGDGVPIGATKLVPEAFQNRLDRETTEGDITIRVVQNDARMAEERQIADEVYGNRSDLPFDVTVHENLTTDELATVLTTDADYFHYIGHTEREGFTCEDGMLDAATLDDVGVDTFLLNACNSYHQGLKLAEKGAIGGIVTLNEVLNDGAVRIGESVARLLNSGFPLRAALTIAREESVLGGQYIVVGDGGITVTQVEGGVPNLINLQKNEDEYSVEMRTYATDERGIGTLFTTFINQNKTYFLSSGLTEPFIAGREELIQFLDMENMPVRYQEDLYWSMSENLTSQL